MLREALISKMKMQVKLGDNRPPMEDVHRYDMAKGRWEAQRGIRMGCSSAGADDEVGRTKVGRDAAR